MLFFYDYFYHFVSNFPPFYFNSMRFAKQKNSVSVRESRNAVKHLDVPEATQVYLVDLQPATVEEARSLIPSLARVPDDELARVLEELNQLSQTGQ